VGAPLSIPLDGVTLPCAVRHQPGQAAGRGRRGRGGARRGSTALALALDGGGRRRAEGGRGVEAAIQDKRARRRSRVVARRGEWAKPCPSPLLLVVARRSALCRERTKRLNQRSPAFPQLQIERAKSLWGLPLPGEVEPRDDEVEDAFDRLNDPPPSMVQPLYGNLLPASLKPPPVFSTVPHLRVLVYSVRLILNERRAGTCVRRQTSRPAWAAVVEEDEEAAVAAEQKKKQGMEEAAEAAEVASVEAAAAYERELNRKELEELEAEGVHEGPGIEDRAEADAADGEGADARTINAARAVNMLEACRSVEEFERLNRIDEGAYGACGWRGDCGAGSPMRVQLYPVFTVTSDSVAYACATVSRFHHYE
jgi:hypothetical protein